MVPSAACRTPSAALEQSREAEVEGSSNHGLLARGSVLFNFQFTIKAQYINDAFKIHWKLKIIN